MIVDDERRHLRVNPAAGRLLGAPVQDIVGRPIDDFTPPEHRSRLEQLWAELRSAGKLEGRYEILQACGRRLPARFSAAWGFAPGQHLLTGLELPRGLAAHGSGPGTALTRREIEILQLAADGCSNRRIAERLDVSPATAKTHLENVYRKLGARDRASAVATALRAGAIV